jgi:hypothetical protein
MTPGDCGRFSPRASLVVVDYRRDALSSRCSGSLGSREHPTLEHPPFSGGLSHAACRARTAVIALLAQRLRNIASNTTVALPTPFPSSRPTMTTSLSDPHWRDAPVVISGALTGVPPRTPDRPPNS